MGGFGNFPFQLLVLVFHFFIQKITEVRYFFEFVPMTPVSVHLFADSHSAHGCPYVV
jgi:hypothetical protein